MPETGRRIEGIFLDYDGTIVDSTEAYIEAARKAYESIGLGSISRKTALDIPKKLELRRPLEEVPPANTSRFLGVYLKTFYESTLEKSRPFSGVDEILIRLSQKAKLALVTMRFIPKDAVIKELETFGLARHFTYIATGIDTKEPKPSPEALVKAANHLSIELPRCMIVGDSISDVRAGKAVGITTVSVLSGLYSREELTNESPSAILENIGELPDYVDFLH